jgi:polyphosphate glucokinase
VSKRLGKPVRLLNDADVHGFGLVSGHGLEVVLTLGTGAGTAVFRDGDLMPHLELAQHPIHNGETYNDYIGDKALRRLGMKKWNSRVRSAIAMLKTLLQYDVLYLGGGNAARIVGPPKGVRIGSNDAALIGGIRMWDMESGYFGGARRGTSSSKRYLKPVGQSG